MRRDLRLRSNGQVKTSGPAPIFHAAVACEIVRRARRRPERKVARRADHDDLHRRRHPHGDHVGRYPVVRADAGVELPRHDVDGRLAHRELQVHVRIRRQETPPDRHDDRRRQVAGIDPQPPHRPLALLVQVLERAGDLIDGGAQSLEQALAGVGHRYAAGRAVEEAHPQTLLELPHGMAERRRRDAEPRGGGAKAARIGNRHEGGQVGKVGALHC